MGNREQHLNDALRRIGKSGMHILAASPVYETAPWGITSQPPFLNQALKISTSLSPQELLDAVLDIEYQMGRIREEKYGPRVMDIDIIFYNHEVIDLPALSVPHPALSSRRFVLTPLNDIARQYEHPVLHKTVGELLSECSDTLGVVKWEEGKIVR